MITGPALLDTTVQRLEGDGVHMVIGEYVNPAGLALAKTVPLARLHAFVDAGLGAAPVFNVFTIDGGIAFTDDITPVGDLRLRLDLPSVRSIGGGAAWGPTELFDQDGVPHPGCPRGLLRRVVARLAGHGLSALVGHEFEFVLVRPDGAAVESHWVPYGLTGILDQEDFIQDLYAAARVAGLPIEQLHAEYGPNQFEFSVAPADPIEAADRHALARLLVRRVARRHGYAASFSPVPFAGAVGNGAHQHFSLSRDGAPLFSGGDGPRGLTSDGAAALGGVVAGIADIQGLVAGSILSGARLSPGTWSGSYACWGTENREAAVRFILPGPANPHGANVEVKVVDPSSNVYLATAAVLALACHGIETAATLADEVSVDPSALTEADRHARGITPLPQDPAEILSRLNASALARNLLGDAAVDEVVAVRRYIQDTYAGMSVEEKAERFRLAWS